jgi:hypothetical protein
MKSLHTLLNYAVTSAEAIICKRWLVQVRNELGRRFKYGWDSDVVLVGWVHDEIVACCRPEIANEVGAIMVRWAKEAGEHYKFRCALDADYKVGRSWAGDVDAPIEAPSIAPATAPEVAEASGISEVAETPPAALPITLSAAPSIMPSEAPPISPSEAFETLSVTPTAAADDAPPRVAEYDAKPAKPKPEPVNGAPIELWLCAPIEPCDLYLINGSGPRPKIIVPNRLEAERFLNLLDPTAVGFTFQTFDDNKDREDEKLARVRNGALDQHWAWLCTMNRAGAGIFVTINETDLQGRTTANVERVRLYFADLDGAPRPAGPPWFIAVETSKEREALYWRPNGAALASFRATQKAIIQHCGSDASVHDLPRVMRLAGFIHHKIKDGKSKGPFLTKIVEVNESAPVVTAADFGAEAPEDPAEQTAERRIKEPFAGSLHQAKSTGPIVEDEWLDTDAPAWVILNSLALANLGKWVPELFGDIAKFQPGTGAYRVKGKHMPPALVSALGRDPEVAYEEDL